MMIDGVEMLSCLFEDHHISHLAVWQVGRTQSNMNLRQYMLGLWKLRRLCFSSCL